MTTRVAVSAHADFADLEAHRLDVGAVVVGTTVAGNDSHFSLFLGVGGARGKTATLVCLARWVELVEALPDDEAVG